MARAKPKQTELTDPSDGEPIAAGPERIPELHALWLSLCELQDESAEAKRVEKAKRQEAGEALRKHGIDHYKADGADLWIEPGDAKVKARRPDARKRGKIQQVTAGGPSEWGPDDEPGDD